jgi:hypothetical protein
MNGLQEIVLNGGIPQHLSSTEPKPPSPRRKGLKQGGGLFLLGVVVVPIMVALIEFLKIGEGVGVIAAIIFFLGGITRMIYALLFESGNPGDKTLEENVYQTAQKILGKKKSAGELPPSQSIPVDHYAPPRAANWRDTNDLEPSSVTDKTTKLLHKE